jgi:YgiT-type zinc finger domain-containing protein
MSGTYQDCFFCGGTVEVQLLPRELRWRGRLHIIEDVPIGVCRQCGEKVLKPEVAKAIDRILKQERRPTRTIEVPVYQYEPDVA